MLIQLYPMALYSQISIQLYQELKHKLKLKRKQSRMLIQLYPTIVYSQN